MVSVKVFIYAAEASCTCFSINSLISSVIAWGLVNKSHTSPVAGELPWKFTRRTRRKRSIGPGCVSSSVVGRLIASLTSSFMLFPERQAACWLKITSGRQRQHKNQNEISKCHGRAARSRAYPGRSGKMIQCLFSQAIFSEKPQQNRLNFRTDGLICIANPRDICRCHQRRIQRLSITIGDNDASLFGNQRCA